MRNNGSQAVARQTVTAVLPAGGGMRFGVPGTPDHQLTVWGAHRNTTVYVGSISDDGQCLAFSDVDLAIPTTGSQAVMWVCVSAADDTPSGSTSVEFSIDGRTSSSTIIKND
ncbi:hypothetical protein [Streptomyces sp. NPDC004270]